MERIEKLRNEVLKGVSLSDEFHYLFYKTYTDLPELAEYARYAEAFCAALSCLTPSISDGELIVGKRDIPLRPAEQQDWDERYRNIARERQNRIGSGGDSHMAIDYALLLHKGVCGVMEMIDAYLLTGTGEKAAFYQCCKRCLQGVLHHAENYAEHALALSRETADPHRKAELEKIAEICRKVPAQPAQTFYEAVQSVHFITHCISLNPYFAWCQQFQLGHPDRYLLPYYEQDIQNGTLTKDFAQLLLDCLGIQINNRVVSGLSSGYMVGGRDENGNIVANDLTEMCMQVVSDIRLVYPAVGLCYTPELPEKYLEQACRLLLNGHSHPAVFNDDVITRGLLAYGVPEAQAHNYVHSTCVEITPVAGSNVWVASPYLNMAQLILDCMDREYPDFQCLVQRILEQLDVMTEREYAIYNRERLKRIENSINPLVSCFVNDCLARGVDIERGGAQYNWIMPSFVGMANLVDSLYAIQKLVFEEKRFSVCQFKAVLDTDYTGNEDLRQYILHKLPKYGNDIDAIDNYFVLITQHIAAVCKKHSGGVLPNGDLIPSAFCWIYHERFGRETSATPDGRKAGFPLGDGSGPCQGREQNGPTASVISSTKWDHTPFIGGIAVNLKFAKSSLGANSLQTLLSVVKAYMQRGGFEVQINVVDNEVLKKAQKDPESYWDLVVRIGGYSDYFVKLSPQMQEEVILRTAHNI